MIRSIRVKCILAGLAPLPCILLTFIVGSRYLTLHWQRDAWLLFLVAMALAGLTAVAAGILVSNAFCRRIETLTESAALVGTGAHMRSLDTSEISARLEAVLRACKDVSILAEDMQGRVTLCNLGTEKFLGYRQWELLGRNLNEIVHRDPRVPDSSVAALKTARHLAAGDLPQEHENVYVRKDGVCLDVQLSVAPLKDMHGQIVGFLHVAHDITPRKLLELELRQKNEQLKKQAQERATEREEYIMPEFARAAVPDTQRPPSLEAVDSWNDSKENVPPIVKLQPKRDKILIVDDFDATRALIKAYLNDLSSNLDLDFAGDGEEALAKIATETYCLVLMDIEMPRMDGHETARRVRTWERAQGRTQLPLIAMTAHAVVENEGVTESAWTASFRKPLSKGQLLRELGKYVKLE